MVIKRKKTTTTTTTKKKRENTFIQIPEQRTEQEELDSEQENIDQDTAQGALVFLTGLDPRGITRSSKEQKLENTKNRPKQASCSKSYKLLPKISNQQQDEAGEDLQELDSDDLALGSGSDDDLDLLSDMPSSISDQSDFSDLESEDSYSSDDSALEQAYYAKHTHRKGSPGGSSDNEPTESKLPIRHPDGTIQRFPKPSTTETSRVIKNHSNNNTTAEKIPAEKPKKSIPSDRTLGSRFGRQPLSEILSPSLDLKSRIQSAKLEIAQLAQEAIADPEMSLGSIKRIFAMSSPTLNHHQSFYDPNLKIDPPIRMMALLSLLAIFLDIIPGYRIRPITEAEKTAKVSQMVARQREWEEGLVSIYKRYVELSEKEIVHNTPLSPCCLKSLCKLLVAKTHFNFTKNIMEIIVRKLGQKQWDEISEECVESVTTVFKNDVKGDDSFQLVRLIVRTIKSKHYSVHPGLLQVLLSLRLKNELSTHIRASTDKVYSSNKDPTNAKTGKLPWKDRVKSKSEPVKISKKARKVMKARAGIEAEIAEAEESVKVEDKERNQTETLKMIFGCYFRIIKLPYRSNLLPIALESLSRFAHLVNIDFFRDLLEILKSHINRTVQQSEHDPSSSIDHQIPADVDHRKLNPYQFRDKLVCILTAFELLSGQGEALNLDLTDIINSFYNLLVEICTLTKLEEDLVNTDEGKTKEKNNLKKPTTTSDLIIKILDFIFFKQVDRPTPQRSNLFSKRILTICLTINDPKLVVTLLSFLNKLAARQPSVKNLFALFRPNHHHQQQHKNTNYQRRVGGGFLDNDDGDDVDVDQLDLDLVAWEITALKSHWHPNVQSETLKLISS